MRDQFSGLKRHQMSVRVFADMTPEKPRKMYGQTLRGRMLVEDVGNELVPFRRPGGFGISIEPANVNVEGIVADGLGRDGYERDLVDAVRGFLREAAESLMAFGEATYEVVYYSDAEAEKAVAFDLSFIAPWTVSRSGESWIQKVPEDYSRRIGSPTRIVLPSDSVVWISPPRSIGRYLTRMMADLDALGESLPPSFALPSASGGPAVIGFDFQNWNRTQLIAVAHATRECGWPGRNLFSDKISEFYYVRRCLDFERFKLNLRESILSRVNEALQIIGNQIGFSAHIVIRGLPDSAMIDASMAALESGSASSDEVLKPYLDG